MKLLTLFVLISSNVMAWTLTEAKRGFEDSNITIEFASNECTNTGFTMANVKSYTKDAVKDYWNKVSTSAINLKVGGTKSSTDVSAATGTTLHTSLITKKRILLGCSNTGIPQFPTNPSYLAVANLNCQGSVCTAYVMLNDAPGTDIAELSKSEVIATIAHELGHAVGLGHTEESFNLMYYSTGTKKQKFLGQDDIDGITWLYPHSEEIMGLLGNCGTLTTGKNYLIDFLAMLMAFSIMCIGWFKTRRD